MVIFPKIPSDIHYRDKKYKNSIFDVGTSRSIFDNYIFFENTFQRLAIIIRIYFSSVICTL